MVKRKIKRLFENSLRDSPSQKYFFNLPINKSTNNFPTM
jgi:hypothetical protein